MCLLVLAIGVHERYPLIVAANRDEFLHRPTEPLHVWPDEPQIIAGRDLQAGGTWLGVSTGGRFAALTNHRDMRGPPRTGPSRGALVTVTLRGAVPPDTTAYPGFNLIHGHWRDLHYHTNVAPLDQPLPPGIHGLSNAVLNTPWVKVVRAREHMAELIAHYEPSMEALFGLLADDTPAPVGELPDTGVGHDWEQLLSSIHITAPGYGTRCSTVLLVDGQGRARIQERSFEAGGVADRRFEFQFA
jgi:uncharacterized protein with NRDE domain